MIDYSSPTIPKRGQKDYTAGLHFVSFGSDDEYIKIAKDTVDSLMELYPNARARIYESRDLPDYCNDLSKKFSRGFGYWHWKPWIIVDYLDTLDDGDLLLYLDGRCGVPKVKIGWIDMMIKGKREIDIVVWSITDTSERRWTTGDLFKMKNIELDSFAAITQQFAATFFMIKKNRKTVKLIENWHDFMMNNSSLTRDIPSKITNHSSFIENRHDQSVFSLTLKQEIDINKVKPYILTTRDLSVLKSIKPHEKYHPYEERYLWAKKIIPRIFRPFFIKIYSKLIVIKNSKQ
jgi:hypothetical protein